LTINFCLEFGNWFWDSNEASKAEKMKVFRSETFSFYLDGLETIAKENNGHLALGKTTWADLWFTAVLDYLNWMNGSNVTDGYPNLQKVVDNTLEIESIKKWIAKRPVTIG
jgi:prostaglandin-H2 D-isomerase / glutathione transferase